MNCRKMSSYNLLNLCTILRDSVKQNKVGGGHFHIIYDHQ